MKIGKLYEEIIKEERLKKKNLNELSILLEKEIKVGQTLTNKLSSIQGNKLANNILTFLNSDAIKSDVNVDYVDYDDKNEKLFTLGYKDREGNNREKLVKLNKLMTYLGGDLSNVKGHEIEDIINHFKKGDISNLKLVSGDDILKAYHCDNYDEGETMGSCMRHEYAQSYLEIFVDNPNKVKCLVLFNPENGKVRGRALVWTLDNGSKFMDRVYTTNKQYEVEFNNFAEQNGLERRAPSNGVTLDNGGDYDEYPYMDTFEYYDPSTGKLATRDWGGYLHLQDTHGGTTSTGMYSEIHGEYIPDDEAVYVDHIEDWVYDYEVVNAWDNSNYLYKDSDDVTRITAGAYEGDYALVDDVIELYNGDTAIGGGIYYIDFGGHEGEYALEDDVVRTFDGEVTLEDDAAYLTAGIHHGEYSNPEDAYILLSGDDEGSVIHYDDLGDYEGEKWTHYVKR